MKTLKEKKEPKIRDQEYVVELGYDIRRCFEGILYKTRNLQLDCILISHEALIKKVELQKKIIRKLKNENS